MSDAAEHVGWQRIKDDVFRPPDSPSLLAVATGIGAQLTLGVFISLVEFSIFCAIPAARPIVLYVSIGVLALCGFFNGYISSRTMKFFDI